MPITHYPVNDTIAFANAYPLDSDIYPVDIAIHLLDSRGLRKK